MGEIYGYRWDNFSRSFRNKGVSNSIISSMIYKITNQNPWAAETVFLQMRRRMGVKMNLYFKARREGRLERERCGVGLQGGNGALYGKNDRAEKGESTWVEKKEAIEKDERVQKDKEEKQQW